MALTARKSHRYLGGAAAEPLYSDSLDDRFELDESEIWAVDDVVLPDKAEKVYSRPARKPMRKFADVADHLRSGPRSLPVNVPDWSKILGGEYRSRAAESFDDWCEDGECVGNDNIPPHEFLARNRVAPFSVTLKGSDLRRVRNAIWKKTGFED